MMTTNFERFIVLVCLLAASIGLGGSVANAEPAVRIGGTGAANELMRRLGEAFEAEHGLRIEVVPNLGSSGAIRALADGVLDAAISGRPLRPEEMAQGIMAVASFRTPYLLVTSHKAPPGLKSVDLPGLYQNPKAIWPDGTPISVVLRPKSDSDTLTLSEFVPGMPAALEAARKRAEVPTAATDQDNTEVAQRLPGSLTGMTLLQFATERPNLRAVPLDGVSPSLDRFETEWRGHSKVLDVVMRAGGSPAARRFIAFVSAPEGAGARILRASGAILVDAPRSP